MGDSASMREGGVIGDLVDVEVEVGLRKTCALPRGIDGAFRRIVRAT